MRRLTLLVLLSFAALCAPSTAWAHSDPAHSFGSFAGYVWFGHVESVHASWVVPRVRRGSSDGVGATWIGAQTAAAQTAFIQIGTLEAGGRAKRHRKVLNIDEAFWSDVGHQYGAQRIFRVKPGDHISASIRLAAGRWTLSITDLRSGARFHKATREEACTSFGQAEWVQEDPQSRLHHAPVPYPKLGEVRFAHLQINRRRPLYRSLFASWMSLPRLALAPSPLSGGSFLIHEAGPIGPAGARYLRLAAADDLATEAFVEEMAGWKRSTPPAKIAAERAKAAAAMRANIRALAGANWPRGLDRPISRLVRAARVLRAQTELAPQPTAHGLSRWKARWTRDGSELGRRAHRVRRALGIPELTPPSSSRRLRSLRRLPPACVRG